MNCNTQNVKIAEVNEKTLVVGINVGSEYHYARAFDNRGVEYSKKAFKFGKIDPDKSDKIPEDCRKKNR